jgi:hypothetical protein
MNTRSFFCHDYDLGFFDKSLFKFLFVIDKVDDLKTKVFLLEKDDI